MGLHHRLLWCSSTPAVTIFCNYIMNLQVARWSTFVWTFATYKIVTRVFVFCAQSGHATEQGVCNTTDHPSETQQLVIIVTKETTNHILITVLETLRGIIIVI